MANPQPFLGPGKYRVELTAADFIKGVSSSDFISDGGLGSSTQGADIYTKPGILRPTNTQTNLNTSASDYSYVASCESNGTAFIRLFAGTDNNIYQLTSAGVISVYKNDPSGNVYAKPYTDMLAFNGAYYISSQNDITEISGGTLDPDWFSTRTGGTALGNNPHPMLIFNKRLYVADGNTIKMFDPDANRAYTVFTGPIDTKVLALEIDPGTGRMLVSLEIDNASGGKYQGGTWVGYYDGVNPTQFLKKIPTEQRITAFRNVGGNIYVIYGENLGVWSGTGIEFLRKMNSAIGDATAITKQKMTSFGQVLLIADGTSILAYGDVIGGSKAFCNFQSTTRAGIDVLVVTGTNTSGVGYNLVLCGDNVAGTTTFVDQITINQTLSGTGQFYSNILNLPGRKIVTGIDVFFDTTATVGSHAFQFKDDTGTTNNCSGTPTIFYNDNVTYKRLLFQKITSSFQLIDTVTTSNVGLKKVIIYFNDYE